MNQALAAIIVITIFGTTIAVYLWTTALIECAINAIANHRNKKRNTNTHHFIAPNSPTRPNQ